MRGIATPDRVEAFMQELGRRVRRPANVYFAGGVTAILHGWRESTIDLDIKILPDSDEVLRAIPEIKESLRLNVELASPDQFIPEVPGWRERSRFIAREGQVSFFHYDLYAQALSKIERGHAQDLADVERMLDDGLVVAEQLPVHLEAIEPDLYRYPAVAPASFRQAVEEIVRGRPR